jgi:putative pyruvate formate lyase activating enzyme
MDGSEALPEQIGTVLLQLQSSGCVNINFVSPSHIVPQLISAVYWAAENGLSVPLVYNSGGYDSVETLRLLDGIIDIYMPDLKFMDPIASDKFMDAPDYPEIASAALKEMHRQVGDLQINEKGLAERGLLVRHLVMPNGLAGTDEAMKFLVNEISPNTYVNIMDQYMPCGRAGEYPEINQRICRGDYDAAVMIAKQQGITRLDDRMSRKLKLF